MSTQKNFTKYSNSDIMNILMLDESEYDPSLTPEEFFDALEGILITKIMGFEENYKEANKYFLAIMKNLSTNKNYE